MSSRARSSFCFSTVWSSCVEMIEQVFELARALLHLRFQNLQLRLLIVG